MAEAPKHVYEVYIRATPEEVWQALTDPELTKQYYYDNTVESDWKPGSPIVYRDPDGTAAIEARSSRPIRPGAWFTRSSSPAPRVAVALYLDDRGDAARPRS